MLRDEAVSLIQKRLLNNQDVSLTSDIIKEMQFVQSTILEGGDFLPWFLLSREVETNSVIGDPRLGFPSSPEFLMEWEQGCLWLYDKESKYYCPIPKMDYEDAEKCYPGVGDIPRAYDQAGDFFWLFPIPSANSTLRMFYYSRDDVLDSNIENKWLKHASDWLIAETGYIIASQYILEEKLAFHFMEQAKKAKARLLTRDTALRESNKSRVMGGYDQHDNYRGYLSWL